jgi:hypothetical protein
MPPTATLPVAQYRRRFLSTTLGFKTLMFLYLGDHRSRSTIASLELHRARCTEALQYRTGMEKAARVDARGRERARVSMLALHV